MGSGSEIEALDGIARAVYKLVDALDRADISWMGRAAEDQNGALDLIAKHLAQSTEALLAIEDILREKQ
jgi:hypothetical protein